MVQLSPLPRRQKITAPQSSTSCSCGVLVVQIVIRVLAKGQSGSISNHHRTNVILIDMANPKDLAEVVALGAFADNKLTIERSQEKPCRRPPALPETSVRFATGLLQLRRINPEKPYGHPVDAFPMSSDTIDHDRVTV